ncbi:hypothetical protein [Methylomonas fluvii]|nr:hypothetical protein [Methylomonas fluvii]
MSIDLLDAVSFLFVASMLALIAGLLCFLREIILTTGILALLKRP